MILQCILVFASFSYLKIAGGVSDTFNRKLDENSIMFSYTGDVQTFTVPSSVTSLSITAWGAGGGYSNQTYLCKGGLGSLVSATIPVTNGTTYYIYVGQQASDWIGGYNGGGNGVNCGTGGNGATDIRTDQADLSSRIIVAAGGGGCYSCCHSADGGGGGRSGLDGGIGCSSSGGGGATQSSGGIAGGSGGNAGTLGYGASPTLDGAGGGGGYYGGGAGNYAGGGGGSSYGPSGATIFGNIVEGNGLLFINYNAPTTEPSEAPTEVPTIEPSSEAPSLSPVFPPTRRPTSASPTSSPVMTYTISRFAGATHTDYTSSGDGSSALLAKFSPDGFHVASTGEIYITENLVCKIRKIDVTGIIDEYAATSTSYSVGGDGGPVSSARVYSPMGITGDSTGKIFWSDNNGNIIRSVSNGIVSTYAGNTAATGSTNSLVLTSASFYNIIDLCTDTNGNVYAADATSVKIRMVSSMSGVSTIAGTGQSTFTSSNKAGTSFAFAPSGVYVDTSGNVFMSDSTNHYLFMMSGSTNIVTTLAGRSGGSQYVDTITVATSAAVSGGHGVSGDSSGNIFVADSELAVVRRVSSGILSTVAGNANSNTYDGDGGAATAATVAQPYMIHAMSSGNIYFSDSYYKTIRILTDPAGAPTASPSVTPSVIPTNSPSYSRAPTLNPTLRPSKSPTVLPTVIPSAQPTQPTMDPTTTFPSYSPSMDPSVAPSLIPSVDPSVAPTYSPSTVRSTSNTIYTIAGTGLLIDDNSHGAATAVSLNSPRAVWENTQGVLYFTDYNGCCVRRFSTSDYIVYGVAGYCGTCASAVAGMSATSTYVWNPFGVAGDTLGYVYIGDQTNSYVHKISSSGTLSYYFGTGAGVNTGDGGPATSASLLTPGAVWITSVGVLYVVSSDGLQIRAVDNNGKASKVVGTGNVGYAGDGGPPTSALIYSAEFIIVDTAGHMYISHSNVIRKVSSGSISTFLGNYGEVYTGENTPLTATGLVPTGLAIDSSNGDFYFVNHDSFRVQVATRTTGLVTTFVGDGTEGFSDDGIAPTSTQIEYAEGLFLNTNNHLYIADTDNCRIRVVSPDAPSQIPTSSPVNPSPVPTLTPTFTPSSAPSSSPIASTVLPTSMRSSTQYMFTIAGTGVAGSTGSEGAATAAWINSPRGVWQNTNGVLYFSEYHGHCVRKFSVTDYIVHDFAGVCGINSYGTPGGPATSTDLYSPLGVFGLTNGDVYIGDSVNNRVAKVSSSGILTNVAGTGSFSSTGDGGAATSANTQTPTWLWVSTSGQVYFVCYDAYVVRTVGSSGIITTFAGTGNQGYTGNGGQATSAEIYNPESLVGDTTGRIHMSDYSKLFLASDDSFIFVTDHVRYIASNVFVPFIGSSISTYNGENIPATSCGLNSPTGLAIDADNGDVYIGVFGSYRIQVMTGTTSLVTTFAGDGNSNDSGNGGPATAAEIAMPDGMFLDTSKQLYFADWYGLKVKLVSQYLPTIAPTGSPTQAPSTLKPSSRSPTLSPSCSPSQVPTPVPSVATTAAPSIRPSNAPSSAPSSMRSSVQYMFSIAGTGSAASSGSEGAATAASINDPRGIWQTTDGTVYFAEYSGNVVREFSTSDYIVHDFAGVSGSSGSGTYGSPGGRATSTHLFGPSGVFGDTNGNLYVGDTTNNRVAKVSSNGILSNVAGNGVSQNSGDNGAATAAQTISPSWIWVSTTGQIYFVCYSAYVIRVISAAGIIKTFAGTGTQGYTGNGGPATSALIYNPSSLIGDTTGRIHMTDDNHVRYIASNVFVASIGSSTSTYNGENIPASSCGLNSPLGLAIDADNGDVYVGTYISHRIQVMTGTTNLVSTFAGNGATSESADGSPATSAGLYAPYGLFLDTSKQLYFSDLTNEKIKLVTQYLPTSAPTTAPTISPTRVPSTVKPSSSAPTSQPSRQPTSQPTRQPTRQPSSRPSRHPTSQPSSHPSRHPTVVPSSQPSYQPTGMPSEQPSRQPSSQPTGEPSAQPTGGPSSEPSSQPSGQPSIRPSNQPSSQPTRLPTTAPSSLPTRQPSTQPTRIPTVQPSRQPTAQPTGDPTSQPSVSPSMQPSSQPSASPTNDPSSAPTKQPFSLPSSLPSLQPASFPSNKPTNQPVSKPSGQPSVMPSSRPTKQPSRRPSRQPSTRPSALPSSYPSTLPSSCPSSQPSIHPSERPSSQPTCFPTDEPSGQPSGLPSTQPSSQPTSRPSGRPSSQPFNQPSSYPSTVPSSRPSAWPSSRPSSQPSRQPSAKPSESPTARPSGQPSCHPTARPTHQPSSRPSDQPTTRPSTYAALNRDPTYKPTSAPTFAVPIQWKLNTQVAASIVSANSSSIDVVHQSSYSELDLTGSSPYVVYGGCKSWGSLLSGDLLVSSLNYQAVSIQMLSLRSLDTSAAKIVRCSNSTAVDRLVSLLTRSSGSAVTVACGGHSWKVSTCPRSSVPSLCVDCSDPCSVSLYHSSSSSSSFFVSPCNAAITSADNQLTSIRVLSVSFEAIQLPPVIRAVQTNVSLTSITVNSVLSGQGTVYCAAYIIGVGGISVVPTSQSQVKLMNFADSTNELNMTSVSLTGLSAASTYQVYCLAVSSLGAMTPMSNVIETSFNVTTACCKIINVVASVSSVSESKSVLNYLTLTLSALPSSSVVLSMSLLTNGTSSAVPQALVPSRVVLTSTSSKVVRISLSPQTKGAYSVQVQVSGGSSAHEFSVLYPTLINSIALSVLGAEEPPPVPVLNSAIFANDGTYMTVSFDSKTNKGNTSTIFKCSELFDFTCSLTSTCQWVSSSVVYAFVNRRDECASPGNSLSLSSHAVIKAQCQGVCASMSSWSAAATGVAITIQPPVLTTVPSVALAMPSVIGACDSLTIDTTGSSGNAGRSWSIVRFAVESGTSTSSSATIASFLNHNYTLSPPTPVPSDLLVKGSVYGIAVTLCNFLGSCGRSSAKVNVLDSVLPVVSLPGLSLRYVTRNTELTIVSNNKVLSCDGYNHSLADVKYTWTIATEGVNQLQLVTVSKDPSKMLLPAYSLDLNALYTVTLTAVLQSTLQSSSASIQVYVQSGDVVAVISSGAASSVVRAGSSLTLNATQSYDEDLADVKGEAAGLLFAWSCYQTGPSLSDNCSSVFSLPSLTNGSLFTVVALSSAVNSTAEVSLMVYDSADLSRSSSASVVVSVLPSASPLVSVTSSAVNGVINRKETLVLSGTVQLPSGGQCSATWSVDDTSVLDLKSVVRSPIAVPIAKGLTSQVETIHSVYLSIAPNMLPLGLSAPLTFSLTCQLLVSPVTGASSVSVWVNTPPQPGVFSVSQLSESESSAYFLSSMDANKFVFVAQNWVDVDLPLQYQFGYVNPLGVNTLLLIRSEFTYGTATVPSAVSANNYSVVCFAQIFDNLLDNTTVTYSVVVPPITATLTASVFDDLSSSLSANWSSLNDVKQVTAFANSLLNAVNCSAAPNCSALFRSECAKTPNTCGACLSGYLGDAEDSNSMCVSIESVLSSSDGKSCSSDGDCDGFSLCLNDVCHVPLKSCPSNCSTQGECVFVNAHGGAIVTECRVGDSNCLASCSCTSGFFSDDCSLSEADLLSKQAARLLVIQTVSDLASMEDADQQSVEAWINSLSASCQSTAELSTPAQSLALTSTSVYISSAASVGLDADTTTSVLDVVNSASLAAASSASSDSASVVVQTESVLQQFSLYLSSSLTPGQDAVSLVYEQFRAYVQVLPDTVQSQVNDSVSIITPLTDLETLSGVKSSIISLSGVSSTSFQVSTVSMNANHFTALLNDSLKSDPLTIQLSSLPCGASDFDCFIDIVMPLNQALTSSVLTPNAVEMVNTTCTAGVYSVNNFTCSDGKTVSLLCNGTVSGVVKQQCPYTQFTPVCNSLDGVTPSSASECSVVSFTNSSITCSCPASHFTRRRRLLTGNNATSGDDGSYSASYVAMLGTVETSFVSTIESAAHLNNQTAAKGWRVIVTIGSFAVCILLALLGSSHLDKTESKAKVMPIEKTKPVEGEAKDKTVVVRRKLPKKSDGGRFTVHGSYHQQQQRNNLKLIDGSLPAILSSSTSLQQKMINEIKQHHRWFGVVFFYCEYFPRVLRVISLASNIIVMLFIQSLTYNLTNPDDGSCELLTNQADCLGPRSPYATGESKCYWTPTTNPYAPPETGHCTYVTPNGNAKIVVFIAIFSAVVSTPLAIFIDWIVHNLLSASTDSHGSHHQKLNKVDPLLNVAPVVDQYAGRRTKGRFSANALEPLSRAQTRLREMTSQLQSYRQTLDSERRKEFDEIWGLDKSGQFYSLNEDPLKPSVMAKSIWKKFQKAKPDVKNKLLLELCDLQDDVEDESDLFKGTLKTDKEKGKRLLFLFQKDLMPGIQGQLLMVKQQKDHITPKKTQLIYKRLGWFLILSMDAAMLFYILLFALTENNHQQGAWFQSFIIWLVIEVLLVSTFIVLLTQILIPLWTMKDVVKIKQILMNNIQDFQDKMASAMPGRASMIQINEQSLTDQKFNAAEYLFVSTQMAKQYPKLKESRIIAQFSTPFPKQSYQHQVDVSKKYSKKFSGIVKGFVAVLVYFLTTSLAVPPHVQDMLVQMMSTLTIGYTVVLHIELFHIFPLLALGPFLVLCIIAHFIIVSGKGSARAKLNGLTNNSNKPLLPQRSPQSAKRASTVPQHHDTTRQSVIKGLNALDELDALHKEDAKEDPQLEVDLEQGQFYHNTGVLDLMNMDISDGEGDGDDSDLDDDIQYDVLRHATTLESELYSDLLTDVVMDAIMEEMEVKHQKNLDTMSRRMKMRGGVRFNASITR